MEPEQSSDRSKGDTPEPGPARLYALLAGAFLCMLGVLGFFYDAGFETGSQLTSDYLAGILLVNGWRNVVYVVTGLLALGLAVHVPRLTALALGTFYLALGVWGVIVTERDVGDIAGVLPLADEDNVLHLAFGGLGLIAVLLDPGRPRLKLPAMMQPSDPADEESRGPAEPDAKRRIWPGSSRGGPSARRRPRATPRPGDGA